MDISELFPAGPILSEERQIGRIPAIEALAAHLRAGDVMRVFDRRRWGKSSVARAGETVGSPETSLIGQLLSELDPQQLTLRAVLSLIPQDLARAVLCASRGQGRLALARVA